MSRARDAFDVVIIGSGPAGAAVAETILRGQKEWTVLMLEAGPAVDMASRRAWWDFVLRRETPYARFADGADDCVLRGETPLELPGSRIFAKGGSSLHWGGWMPRFQPEDFALRSAAGIGCDWPISYDDLERYYGQAERFMQVAGASSERERPPRSTDYPFEAPAFVASDRPVMQAFDKLGYSYGHVPVCRNGKPVSYPEGEMAACETNGTCKYCPVQARYTADQTLYRLNKTYAARFELCTGAAVARIEMSTAHRAERVVIVDGATGAESRIAAGRVIVAAGALESPKLLLASSSTFWPRGLGNASGHVGRHLIAHPLIAVTGMQANNRNTAFDELNFPTLGSRHFDSPAEQPKGKLMIVREHDFPTVPLAALMAAGTNLADLRKTLQGPQRFQLNGFIEELADQENAVELASGKNAVGLPRTQVRFTQSAHTTAAVTRHVKTLASILEAMGAAEIRELPFPRRADHAMSTCRMAADAAEGVVSADLRVHGTDNVFVCSNAVFPSGAAANPTLTLVALAVRLGEHLATA